jgi:hypothetical protein
MTLRRPDEDAIVTARDITMIRRLLVTCPDVLIWAGLHAGTDYHYAVMDITAAAGRPATAGGLVSDVNLAIDCLDFAGPARSTP